MIRKNRVESLFSGQDKFNAFITKSPADIAYLIGITFPYPYQSPFSAALVAKKGSSSATLILPVEWECVLKSFTWEGKAKTYNVNDGSPEKGFRDALKSVIDELDICGEKVAIDYSFWTVGEIRYIKENCPQMYIVDLDPIIKGIREIKSPDEVENIQMAAHIADRGIIGALNHIEGSVGLNSCTLSDFLEHVRISAIEFGAHSIGHLNIAQGRSGNSWITPIYDLSLVKENKTIRVDYTLSYNGCWTNCSRMFFTGKPGENTANAYRQNMELKDFAVSILKPGIKVSDFCEAVRSKAEDESIELLYDEGLGHGVGASEYERPYLTADNNEVLKAGMVIALDVKTIGYKDELLHSVDVYELTRYGNRRLSDFRDWNTLYRITGVRSSSR
ncbi:MAG: aminopeptidase P family protein [Flexilinea sp.]|nr:aminopeptidase P family protein [Flexilinea sp.]